MVQSQRIVYDNTGPVTIVTRDPDGTTGKVYGLRHFTDRRDRPQDGAALEGEGKT